MGIRLAQSTDQWSRLWKVSHEINNCVHALFAEFYIKFIWEKCISHTLCSFVTTVCPKNKTRKILNILYSSKSIAMKFNRWYPDDLAIKRIHNLPPHLTYVSTIPDKLHHLPLNSVSGSEKNRFRCVWSGSEPVVWLNHSRWGGR